MWNHQNRLHIDVVHVCRKAYANTPTYYTTARPFKNTLAHVSLAQHLLHDFPLLVFIAILDGLSIIHECLIVCLLNGLF